MSTQPESLNISMNEGLITKSSASPDFVVVKKQKSLLEDEDTGRNRSLAPSFLVLLLMLPIYPFAKLMKLSYHFFSIMQYICFILVFIGIALDTYPLAISLYIFIVYFGMVFAEFQAITATAQDFSFISILRAFIDFSEWERLSDYAGQAPRTLGGKLKLFCAALGVLFAFAASVGIAYGIEGTITFNNIVAAISTCALGYILSRILRIIDLVYMVFRDQVSGKKVQMNSFFEKFDSQSAVQTIEFCRTSSKLCKRFKAMFLPIEFAQTFGFVYLAAVVASSFFINFGGLTNYLLTDTSKFTDIFERRFGENGFLYGYVFLLTVLILINLFTFFYKLKVSFFMNKIYDSNTEKFDKIQEQLSYLTKLPQMFITPKRKQGQRNPKNDEQFTLDDIVVQSKNFQNVFRLECPIAEIIWRRITEEEDIAQVSYRTLRELTAQYASEINDLFDFIRKEYLDFYAGIEYKFMGVLKVDQPLITKMVVTAGTAVSTLAIGYVKSHTTVPST